MPAVALDSFERGACFLRHLAINAIKDEFGIAQDRVERCAQLVARVGEDLRLVLARDFHLLALLADFAEQPRVLDRQRRLSREGLQEVERVLWELARLPAG